jgi:hypothetical protein
MTQETVDGALPDAIRPYASPQPDLGSRFHGGIGDGDAYAAPTHSAKLTPRSGLRSLSADRLATPAEGERAPDLPLRA